TFTRERLVIQEEELGLWIGHEKEVALLREESRLAEEKKAPGRHDAKRRLQQADGSMDGDEDRMEKHEVSVEEFVTAVEIEGQLDKFHVVEFGASAGGHEGRSGASAGLGESEVIDFHTKAQPSFNRQFELLIKDLKALESKKYTLYLFAENPRQLERLHTIFEDLKANIPFTPVALSIHEGFIDDDLKIVCYTDHQIFQRYHKYKVKQAYNKNKAITLRTLRELQPGD